MEPSDRSESHWHRALLFLTGLLVLPALLIHLNGPVFIDDEGIRSLVAFEMLESGEFIQATINGEPYFKKPPLYNWILAAGFSLTGIVNEWTARIPTVIFLLLFAALIYRSVRKGTGQPDTALVSALLTLTCGRILFWDSFLGLIDMAFSTLVFAQFMWLYEQDKRNRPWAYFTGSWILAGVAFLMKGLPGLVFQVMTVGGHLVLTRRWRRLFHPGQWVGGLVFILMTGTYYALLLQNASPEQVFGTLFHESAQRTPTHHGFIQTLSHLATFPMEMTYHFLPWSLLLVFVLTGSRWRALWRHPFFGFLMLVFAVNIPVYWVSPQVYPRYLLMLAPLVFTVGYEAWKRTPDVSVLRKSFRVLFLAVSALLAVAAWTPLFLPQTAHTTWLGPKTGVLVILMVVAAWAIWRYPRLLFYGLIVQLLTLRLAFDWFVIPDRLKHDTATAAREDALRVGAAFRDKPLYYLDQSCLSTTSSFYLSTSREAITTVWKDRPQPGTAYLVDASAAIPPGFIPTDTIRVRHFNDRIPYVLLIESAPDIQ